MRHSLTVSTILFLSIVKWVVLATFAGAIVGAATAGFLKVLAYATALGSAHEYSFLLLPFAMFLSAVMVQYLAPDAKGHGTEKVIEAIHKRAGRIPAAVVPVKLLATIVTLGVGGSVGKEGPCAQIGAGLTSLFSDIMKFDDHDRKKLVICGISAGFAAVFGTPIAGSIFGVEVLFVGNIMYEVLLPSFIAGITAFEVSSSLGVTYFHEPVSIVPVFSEAFLLKVILAGIFFGLCSIYLIEVLRYGEKLANGIKIWSPAKGIIGGAALIVLTFIFSTNYLGLGLHTIEACMRGEPVNWYAFLVKPVFSSITLGFGGSGGIVTPIFFVGATAGVAFAVMTGLNSATFAAIGFVSVLAGAANTPIAASILSVEIFGPSIAPYATVACVISFLMTGHRSVYHSQVLSISKSPSLGVEIGGELEHIRTTVAPKGMIKKVFDVLSRIERIVNKYQSRAEEEDEGR